MNDSWKVPYFEDIYLSDPKWLWLLLLVPLIWLAGGRKGPVGAVVFSSLHLLGPLGKGRKSWFGRVGPFFAGLSLAAISVALARPQKVEVKEEFSSEGIEIQVVIDVSLSMSISDFFIGAQRVWRIDAAKAVISEFIRERKNDRIGLVIFAGLPYTLGPLTMEHDWLLERLADQVHLDHNLEQGTAIGAAITAATKRLADRKDEEEKNREAGEKPTTRIVILLTDGDQTVGSISPVDAAKLAGTLGIKIYPVAIGTEGIHALAPKYGGGRLEQSFDFDTLEKVAQLSKGKAFLAKDSNTLAQIFREIDQLEKSEIVREKIIDSEDLFPPVLGLALLLAILSLGLRL